MDNFTATILPTPIVYATAISIIVIALAILIWLVLTIVFGTLLLKKVNELTKNMSRLTETWNEKSKQIADQTTATIQSFQLKPKGDSGYEKKNNFASVLSGIFGFGSMLLEIIKLVNQKKSGKEK
jgi:predicted PurR-regulated permease PerM